MAEFFKPYEGSRPFLFISYAHRQSDAVVGTIRLLHEKGYRVWYDEGIPAGSDWPSNIARHMQGCERVIFFLSRRAMESQNCYSEMRTAFRLGKPVLIVRLEDAPTEERWQELLSGREEIPLLPDAPERAQAILQSGFVPRRFRHVWWEALSWRALGLAASLVFFLASAASLAALASGYWTPRPQPPERSSAQTPASTPEPSPPPVIELGEAERFFAVTFPDRTQERGIRAALGMPAEDIYRWQLAEIEELYLCGSLAPDSLDAVDFDTDGVCRVNGAPIMMGQVRDLRLVADMARLELLGLVCQPVDDLSALSGLTRLREVSLAGSSVSDLGALHDLPSLETIHLEHTAVKDLAPLAALPRLKTVTVSREQLPLEWPQDAGFQVVLHTEN